MIPPSPEVRAALVHLQARHPGLTWDGVTPDPFGGSSVSVRSACGSVTATAHSDGQLYEVWLVAGAKCVRQYAPDGTELTEPPCPT